MPKIDVKSVPEVKGTGYPAPFDVPCLERVRKRLGDAGGLSQFGVNLVHLPPGGWSSQRHWHSNEDEFVYVLSGEVVQISDAGEKILRAGDCAAYPKNEADGHHLVNKSSATAIYLEIGTRTADDFCSYPDIDLQIDSKLDYFAHKDGTPYPSK
jgi:uncharacterized cupin superfamily protein